MIYVIYMNDDTYFDEIPFAFFNNDTNIEKIAMKPKITDTSGCNKIFQ